MCGQCFVLGVRTKKHVSKLAVCASAEVAKKGGLLNADTTRQITVKG